MAWWASDPRPLQCVVHSEKKELESFELEPGGAGLIFSPTVCMQVEEATILLSRCVEVSLDEDGRLHLQFAAKAKAQMVATVDAPERA